MTDAKIFNGFVAHDILDCRTYDLDIKRSLDFTSILESSFLSTNQVRAHGFVVKVVLIFLHSYSHDSIIFPDEGINLLLMIHGPVSNLLVPTSPIMRQAHVIIWSYLAFDFPWNPMLEGCIHRKGAYVITRNMCWESHHNV